MNLKMNMGRWIKQGWLISLYLYQRLIMEGCTYRAASLAYTTLLSIVPVMIIAGTIISFFPAFKGEAEQIQQFILQNFVAQSANLILEYLNDFTKHISRLSITNILFLIVVGILLIHNINSAFTAIWKAGQPLWFSVRALIYLIVLLLSPILLATIFFFSTFVIKLTFIANLLETTGLKRILFITLPYLLVFVTFTLLNWVLPSCKVRLAYAAVGGLVSAILFELAKYIFVLYFLSVPTYYHLLYGALAAIPIFLVWLYISWVIVLLGAIISHTMATGLPAAYRVQS